MKIILYQQNADNSFAFREVDNLDDYEEMGDGRLYYEGDENDLWWQLDLSNDLFDASDDYVMAFTAYRLDRPDVFAKARKYDEFAQKSKAGVKDYCASLTPEQRSERAKKAVEARKKKLGW